MALSDCVYPGEQEQRRTQFGIPESYSDHQVMIERVRLDAAVISTPHACHYRQAYDCLRRGLHVLVDKPGACRAVEMERLADLAEATGRILLVASQRRYDPAYGELRSRLRSGEVGELVRIEYRYGRSRVEGFLTSWRNDPVLSGGGVLLDAGYHLLDILQWLTGRHPIGVRGYLDQRECRVDTAACLELELEGRATALVVVHLDMPPGVSREELDLIGTRGVLSYRRLGHPSLAWPIVRIESMNGIFPRGEDRAAEPTIEQGPARNFIHAILGRESVRSSGRDGNATIRTIEWIYSKLGAAPVAAGRTEP